MTAQRNTEQGSFETAGPARIRGLILFLFIAVAVGVAATLGLSALQQRLERSRMAQTAITEIRLDTTALAALTLMESQRPAVGRTMAPLNTSTLADLQLNLERLASLIDDHMVTGDVRDAATRFVEEIDRSQGTLANSANPLSSGPYMAWFTLDGALATVDGVAERRAAAARRDARVGTWLIVVIFGGLIALLAGRFTAERSRSRQLAHRAATDALSGLRNRGDFDRHLGEKVGEAHNLGTPLSVVVVDVDHFKDVNDTYGHAVGDDVIVEVARRLSAEGRAHDILARLGGDEFAWLMPGVGDDDAARIALRALRVLNERPFGVAGVVTASVGVATLNDHRESGDDLMRRADEALYAAKRDGRAQVAAATTSLVAATD